MKAGTVHEPNATMMSATEVWEDAQQVASVLRKNLLKAEPSARQHIPLAPFLLALESFSREELILVQERVQEKLAA